jgi:hypothetical protein
MIKNPLDFFFSSYNTIKVNPVTDTNDQYKYWVAWYWKFLELGMTTFSIPSVAGWQAYHQAPLFYRNWINSASLNLRKKLMDEIDGMTYWLFGVPGYDFLQFIETLDDPSDANALVEEVCQLLYPREMTMEQQNYFKDILIPGLPDFEWTVEYNTYLSDPSNLAIKQSVEGKLNGMFHAMMDVPEFHLS